MLIKSIALALKIAIKGRSKNIPLIHHSDRGLQYCSAVYQKLLNKNEIILSTTDRYDYYQNTLAERLNGIFKQEFLFNKCNNYQDLKRLIKQSVDIYNNKRSHLALRMKTPNFIYRKLKIDKYKSIGSYNYFI